MGGKEREERGRDRGRKERGRERGRREREKVDGGEVKRGVRGKVTNIYPQTHTAMHSHPPLPPHIHTPRHWPVVSVLWLPQLAQMIHLVCGCVCVGVCVWVCGCVDVCGCVGVWSVDVCVSM